MTAPHEKTPESGLSDIIEVAVLTGVMMYESLLDEVAAYIGQDGRMFVDPFNARIYEAYWTVRAKRLQIDPAALLIAMGNDDGITALARISDVRNYSWQTGAYAKEMAIQYQRREMGARLTALGRDAKRDTMTPDEVRAELQDLEGIDFRQGEPVAAADVMDAVIDAVGPSGSVEAQGFPTGFASLTRIIHAFRPGELTILAARTGMGKTALALNIAEFNGVSSRKNTLIFSYEMGKEQLMQRLMSISGGIDWRQVQQQFATGPNRERISTAHAKLGPAPIYIVDDSRTNIYDLCSAARKHVKRFGASLIVVDYIQLIAPSPRSNGKKRHEEVGEFSRELKLLAEEVRCPIIALAQLNRESEDEDSGYKMLRYLRESGSLEQDADIVLILHDVAKPKTRKGQEQAARVASDNIVLTVAKHRNGPTGKCLMRFDKPRQKFFDVETHREPQDEDISRVWSDGDTPF